MSHVHLSDFEMIRPPYELEQEKGLEWIAKAHAKAEASIKNWEENSAIALEFYEDIKQRLFRLGMGPEKVQKRGSQTEDFFHKEWEKMDIYNLNASPEGLSLKERTLFYEKAVDEVFERLYPEQTELPCHLIHVSCTGYVSPSGAQKIVAKRRCSAKTTVTHAYHMGCYAYLPALRTASGFLSSSYLSSSEVDIVHSELCSLHMNPSLHETSQLIVQSLFGDGFIKYRVSKKPNGNKPCLTLLSLHEELIPDSTKTMTWKCEHWGFRMELAKELPFLIREACVPFLSTLIQKAGLEDKKVKENAFFAIHPGGPKIIQQIAELLYLNEEQYQHSKVVLRDYGNMSSATLPHVWQKLLNDSKIPNGAYIVTLAYGPGLCFSGALFQKGS